MHAHHRARRGAAGRGGGAATTRLERGPVCQGPRRGPWGGGQRGDWGGGGGPARILCKKKTLIAKEADRPAVVERRRTYLADVRHIAATRLVFVDETGTNASMTPLYSRAKVGERAFGKVPRNHGTNLTVVGAVALDGVRAIMAYEAGTTKAAFPRFVRAALPPNLRRGDVVVMDNLKSHYAEGVRESIESVGASLLYLPPYSPQLNPIEHTWSKLKALLRRAEARTLRLLAGALSKSSSRITKSDILGWFRDCGYEAQRK